MRIQMIVDIPAMNLAYTIYYLVFDFMNADLLVFTELKICFQ